MKKLAAVFVAAVMMLSMCLTVFAEGTNTLTVDGGDNDLSEVTFKAYKLFDITGVDQDDQYGYTPDTDFEEWLEGKATGGYNSVYDYVKEQIETASTAQKFLGDLATKIQDGKMSEDATAVGSGYTVKFTELADGYYVIFATASDGREFNPIATNVTEPTTVYVKVKNPGITKEAGDDEHEEWEDVQIGDQVPFKVTVQVPNPEGMDKSSYVFQVVDQMSDGLTFDETSVEIKIDDTLLKEDIDYTVTSNPTTELKGTKVTFDFATGTGEENPLSDTLMQNIGKNITISYKATLNENAVVNDPETNNASLKYTNASGVEEKGEPVETDIYTYGYTVIKRADDGTTGKLLPGAEFEVYEKEANNPIKFVEVTGTGYRVAKEDETGKTTIMVSNDEGKIYFYGLDAGEYVLRETKAPDGYNKLKDDITFTISNNEKGIQIGKNEETVVNKSGTLLPGTGGTGSIVFAIAGGLIVLGGGLVLFRNRKRPEA